MKTLKLCNEYRNLTEASASICESLEKIYNQEAAALGARLPAASRVRAKAQCEQQGCRFAAPFFMSFPRHPETYPPMEAQTNAAHAPAHRLDEFPAGYSLAGCAPAEPPPLHQP